MTSITRALLCGFAAQIASAFVVAASAEAATAVSPPLVVAQIDTAPEVGTLPPPESAAAVADDPVAAARKAVETARAALRHEMATGGDVRGARSDLQAAIRHLNEVKDAADAGNTTPADGNNDKDTETAEAPPKLAAPQAPPAELKPLAPPETPAAPPTTTAAQAPEVSGESTAAEPPQPTSPAPSEPPTLAAPATPPQQPAAAELPAKEEPTQETSTAEPPSEATPDTGKSEEKPSFFQRLFGGGSEPEKTEEKTANTDATAKDAEPAKQPGLPIFRKLPPIEGPKVVAVTPGETEVVAEKNDNRVVVEEDGRMTVKHDDNDRFRRSGENIKVAKGQGGTTVTTVTRSDGTEVVTVRDAGGDILQRYRKKPNGEVEMLIGDRDNAGRPRRDPNSPPPAPQSAKPQDFAKSLPKLNIQIPRNQYIVGGQGASRSQIEQALVAPPVETIERPYSLEEIRRSERLRAKLRRIDIDTVTFESGAATVGEDQIPNLQAIGNALADIIAADPNQVFLIEGHTDAVGSDVSNLALSDRRAESIAEILTFYFNIPPENLITQGYGEQYLKVLTAGPERLNRRASVRRITPLLVGQPVASAQ